MRAIQLDRFGGPEVLELVEIPRPEPGPGEGLVANRAWGVNFVDTQHREGVPYNDRELPLIPGIEAAGVVEELGDGVQNVAVGDRVIYGGHLAEIRGDQCGRRRAPSRRCRLRTRGDDVDPGHHGALPDARCLRRHGRGSGPRARRGGGRRCPDHRLCQIAGRQSHRRDQQGREARRRARGGGGCRDQRHPPGLRRSGARRERWGLPSRIQRPRWNLLQGRLAVPAPAGCPSHLRPDHRGHSPVDLRPLRSGSLRVTWTSLRDFNPTSEAATARNHAVFEDALAGVIPVRIAQKFPFARAGDAHRLMETSPLGKIIIVP